MGFVRKRKICPSFTALTAISMSLTPVSITRMDSGETVRTAAQKLRPIHTRHAHIRYHNGIRPVISQLS